MKKILVALLLLTIIPAGALAQSNPPLSSKRIRLQGQAAPPTPNPPTDYYNLWVDSATGALNITDSAGTDTPVGAGITGLTTGVVPQAGSATTIVNSKMTTSGTNSGTWTLYDDTGGTGLTKLALREGPGQGSTSIIAAGRASDGTVGFEVGFGGGPQATVRSDFFVTTGSNVYLDTYNLRLVSGLGAGYGQINWNVGPSVFSVTTVALYSPAPGILAVTDGSTGQGGIGISDSATNTVSDALILRHQGGTVAGNGFGTGLLFQGENDGGVMHDMASIDAVWSLDDDTNEQSQFKFSTYDVGGELPILTLYKSGGETRLDAPYNMDLISGNILALYGATQLTFVTNAANKWIIPSTGAFYPATTNTYDIGTSSAFVRNNYVSTSIQGTRTKTLTDNTITDVVQISSAVENNVTAGHISYTVVASDATNELVQTEVGQVPFLLVNENGTVTVTLGTVGVTAIDSAGGAALSNTFASSVSGTDAKIRITSDYDQATLTGTVTHTIEYRVYIDSGTATVTPQ